VPAHKLISKNMVQSMFPNVITGLRMNKCLMITNAAGVRTFSKLKLLKNCHQSSTMQKRQLTGHYGQWVWHFTKSGLQRYTDRFNNYTSRHGPPPWLTYLLRTSRQATGYRVYKTKDVLLVALQLYLTDWQMGTPVAASEHCRMGDGIETEVF